MNWLDVADLNFDNAAMRLAMIDAMKYWVLEANVDGYRCDYADGVPLIYGSQEIGRAQTIPFFSNTTLDWSDALTGAAVNLEPAITLPAYEYRLLSR